MTNIPTDLLRTLVAVVDMRSFTKAAAKLGVTQPAVSAQIKRLQFLLDGDLLDRSVPGVSLTPQGEMVVSYARRLLSINDQIVHIGGSGSRPELVIRVGTPSDYVASILPRTLARFREQWPGVRFIVDVDSFDRHLRALRSGELDVLVGLSVSPQRDARHSWLEEVVWVRDPFTTLDLSRPVPLVTYGEPRIYHRIAVDALRKAGLEWEEVFTGPSMPSLKSAVAAGLGVTPLTRRRALDQGMIIWDDSPLPKLPDVHSGVYIREGGERDLLEQLADEIATILRQPGEAAEAEPLPAIVPARAANSAA